MTIIRSDLIKFEGRRMLQEAFAQQIRTGRRITVTDDILMQYFMSLRITEQYPSKVMTAEAQTQLPDYLVGLFANMDI
jgi:hypothetical protein